MKAIVNFFKWLFKSSEYELTIKHLGDIKKYHIKKIYSLSTTNASFKTINDEKHTLKSSEKMSWELRKIKNERN
tara:strand:- start:316 stop:537 length:222 start_codon:yes stop_codon:yes gene_type:complete